MGLHAGPEVAAVMEGRTSINLPTASLKENTRSVLYFWPKCPFIWVENKLSITPPPALPLLPHTRCPANELHVAAGRQEASPPRRGAAGETGDSSNKAPGEKLRSGALWCAQTPGYMPHVSARINKQLPNSAPEVDQASGCIVARVERLCFALIVERLQS